MNILLCSVGRRGELMKYFKASLDTGSKIIATDNSNTAPALYIADKQYIVPKITDRDYIPVILDICIREKIKAITTFIDPEIAVLADNKPLFGKRGVKVLAPSAETARLCFDKYEMYKYLRRHGINTMVTYANIQEFSRAYNGGQHQFPVFVKPRTGSASVGARKVNDLEELGSICNHTDYIIQEYMDGDDLDVDVYVDMVSHKPVSIFAKRKLETRIGGASKTISFKDHKLFETVAHVISKFRFNGPLDMDFFYKNGKYFLSEINPRFGGAYIHAHRCGVDFVKLIINNLNGVGNTPKIGDYEDNVLMMMYDSVVIRRQSELA